VSNADLAPTLAALAGVARDPTWDGSSLLEGTGDRTALAFQLGTRETARVAVIRASHKIFAATVDDLSAGEVARAFELGTDPVEEHDVSEQATWPAELARTQAARLRALVDSLQPALSAPARAEERQALRALGYGGDD